MAAKSDLPQAAAHLRRGGKLLDAHQHSRAHSAERAGGGLGTIARVVRRVGVIPLGCLGEQFHFSSIYQQTYRDVLFETPLFLPFTGHLLVSPLFEQRLNPVISAIGRRDNQ